MSEERLIELESRVAFQEESIQILSQSVRDHQQALGEMHRAIEALRQRLNSVSPSPLDADLTEPPPPHY